MKKRIWAGRILSALPVLMLTFSAVVKFMKSAGVVEGFARLGYPEHLIVPIGLLELICTILYAIPRTSVLGAILVTGYLGGATATNVRVEDPSFFAPAMLGVFVWLGLFLRYDRLRSSWLAR